MKIVMSSGHGRYIRGAADILDEVNEARRVVDRTAAILNGMGVGTTTFHDDVSRSQNENLHRIVDFHNSKSRDWDVSVHFNAYQHTQKPMGTEVLYVSSTGQKMARVVVDSICSATPLTNRGPKQRTDLYFLNNTAKPAVLIETCFVDSQADADIYRAQFEDVCAAIASGLAGQAVEPIPPEPEPDGVLFQTKGRCSQFGGPDDSGVSPSEGLAFIYNYNEAPHLFLPHQPEGTTGLARRLNPNLFYVACRWDYEDTPKDMLKRPSYQCLVRANNKSFLAWPADWGPHGDTNRVADLSPGLMGALGLRTDDEVEVIYPWSEEL